jgi:hypothetical protein
MAMEMKKNLFTALMMGILGFSNIVPSWAEQSPDDSMARKIFEEIKRGSFEGVIGIYYEFVDHSRDGFVEDDEFIKLDDSDLIVPYFQIDYITPEYYGFSLGVGLTGYTHINGDSGREDKVENFDEFVFHQLYLKYGLSETSLKIGRHELKETVFLSDYYEALSITSEEIENLIFRVALVDEVAEADIDKFIEFQNINRGDETIDDYLYAAEITWDVVPDTIAATLYFYHQGNLYSLYGTHVELLHETEEIGFGLNADFYVTDEDSRNGLRDANEDVRNSDIYHINPFIEFKDFILSAGYIEADRDVGGREGGLIDDYFNPLNEGDKVYEPGGQTWYGSLEYEREDFEIGLIYGKTDYLDDGQRLTEKEFDITASFRFIKRFKLEAEFARVNSESPEGDFSLLEMALTYRF